VQEVCEPVGLSEADNRAKLHGRHEPTTFTPRWDFGDLGVLSITVCASHAVERGPYWKGGNLSKKLAFEKFEISMEQKIRSLCALEDKGYTILCSRCHSPMRSHTVKMVYEHGTA
jgi:hypothetical protein